MKKLTWGIALLPLMATAAAVNFLPEKVPVHYNAAGEIDNWGSRNFAFIFPLIILIITAIFELLYGWIPTHTKMKPPNSVQSRTLKYCANSCLG